MKAVVAAFNQEKALIGAFSVITNLRMELFQALGHTEVADLITQPTLANDRLYFLSFCLVSSLGTCPAQTGPVWNQYKIAHVRIDQ